MVQTNQFEQLLPAGTTACVLYSTYSKESKEAFRKIESVVTPWFEGTPFELDSGGLFTSSTTLFLNEEQKEQLQQLIDNTPVSLYTISSLHQAFEQGRSSDLEFLYESSDSSDKNWQKYMFTAGVASAKLDSELELTPKELRSLGFSVWTGLSVLLNLAASISQSLNRTFTRALANEAVLRAGNEDSVNWGEVHTRAGFLTREAVYSAPCFQELGRALRPMADTLLRRQSPEMKQIVYHLCDNCYGFFGHVLGISGDNQSFVLGMLDDWEAFMESRIQLLSKFLSEDPDVRDSEDSAWRTWMHSCGDFTALSAYIWNETFFSELRHEHFWALKYLGVTGRVGDRTFEILNNLLEKSLREALSCQQAYAEYLTRRVTYLPPGSEAIDEQDYLRYVQRIREQKKKDAVQLIHGVADSIINGLPWVLPNDFSPKPYEPVVHLNRTIDLLENALNKQAVSLGTAEVARQASRELAIQLNQWKHLEILDQDVELKERLRLLFELTNVSLPEGWADNLQKRSLLPHKPEQ